MPTEPSKKLETFPNPRLDRDYIIEIECPEFTCLCPRTGQPDFATLTLEYVPDRWCVELKSLKLYIWSFRNEGHFHEDVTNRILNDLVTATQPRFLRVRAKFNVRGGIYTTVEVEHRASGWKPAPPLPTNDMPRVVQELPEKQMPHARAKPAPIPLAPHPATPPQPPTMEAPASFPEPEPAPEEPHPPSDRFRMLNRRRRPAKEYAAAPAAPEPTLPKPPPKREELFIGIDLGSSGCRAVAVDHTGLIQAETSAPIPPPLRNDNQITQDPTLWWKAVNGCLQNLLKQIDPLRVTALAVDGTSGTLLLCDDKGNPITPAIMYNDKRAVDQAKKITGIADANSGAQGATSSLAKLKWLQDRKLDKRAAHVLHQADWISGRLTGNFGHSDYNNCLKLGYDAEKKSWPTWIKKLDIDMGLLPEVHEPGATIGSLHPEIAKSLGLPSDTQIKAGTTDSIAAVIAAGCGQIGHGMTALGTTLVLKLLSDKPVFSAEHGVYSHRLGRYWLVGGASNTGGAVLLQYYKVEQMREMTPMIDAETFTGLDYYPLPDIGERFPINNPEMTPRLEPLPGDSVTFFQGMLEGIARIEAQGYQLLEKLGAPKLTEVYTTGGGAQNPAWERLRERILRVKMKKAQSKNAALGSALLAAGIVSKTFQ